MAAIESNATAELVAGENGAAALNIEYTISYDPWDVGHWFEETITIHALGRSVATATLGPNIVPPTSEAKPPSITRRATPITVSSDPGRHGSADTVVALTDPERAGLEVDIAIAEAVVVTTGRTVDVTAPR